MGEGAHRDEVDAGFGEGAQGFEGDSAARLQFLLARVEGHGLAALVGRKVVEHDAVDAGKGQGFAHVVEAAALYFDGTLEAALGQVGFGAAHGLANSPRQVDVVVFEHDHVVQADAVVAPAAHLNRPFFEHAPARRGFAGVEQGAREVGDLVGVAPGLGGHAAEPLDVVEQGAFGAQQGAQGAADFGRHLSGIQQVAVGREPGCA